MGGQCPLGLERERMGRSKEAPCTLQARAGAGVGGGAPTAGGGAAPDWRLLLAGTSGSCQGGRRAHTNVEQRWHSRRGPWACQTGPATGHGGRCTGDGCPPARGLATLPARCMQAAPSAKPWQRNERSPSPEVPQPTTHHPARTSPPAPAPLTRPSRLTRRVQEGNWGQHRRGPLAWVSA